MSSAAEILPQSCPRPDAAAAFALRWPTRAQFWGRAVRPSWPLVALAAAILLAGTTFGPFVYAPWDETLSRVSVVAAFMAGAALFAANGRARAALMMEAFALTIAVALTVPGLTTMIAALEVPYRDAELLAADNALGFDWQTIVLAVRDRPALSVFMSHCYSSLLWQPLILLPLLAYVDPERLRRVLGASTLALCLTVAVFVFVPAKTGYVHLGYQRADFPDLLANTSWGVYEILHAVRAGERQLSLEGLVTFPSYHAVAAVLFAYAWLAVPVLRWPFFALNVVMLVACVPIGSHYVVDVLAGVVMTPLAYVAVNRYYAKTDPNPPLAPWHQTPEGLALANRTSVLAGQGRPRVRDAA